MVDDLQFHNLGHILPYLVGVRIVKKVGPVWVRLHEPELKELPEAQLQDVEGDLDRETQLCV